MKASYFLNGLKKTIKFSVANVDIAASFDAIVDATVGVEKRLGVSKKKKKQDDSNEDFDSNSNEDNVELEDLEDSKSSSDSNSKKESKRKSIIKQKIFKHKIKAKRQKGKKKLVEDDQLLIRLKALESTTGTSKGKPTYQICSKEGHYIANSWYNPISRGKNNQNFQREHSLDILANQIYPTQNRGGFKQPRGQPQPAWQSDYRDYL